MAAGRGIEIVVIGDDRSALRMWERQIGASETTGKAYKKVALSAQQSAQAQVVASVRAMRAQEANIANLRALAVASPAGSRQQIAATVLAADAQAKLARSQGLTVASTRHLSAATKEGERDLGKLARGGLAGAGVFHTLGRSLAFASGGFIAFAIAAGAVSKSIAAARELAVAQRQVNQQLRVSGKSWKDYAGQIEPATTRLVHLAGFTHVDLLRSFGFMVRATGNVQSSLKLMGVAADVARGRGIRLQAATLALTKAVGGSATALRRLGIIVPSTAKGWDAINFVAEKFRGQARAGTSAVDRFNATLNLTAEITGQTLLPIVNRYLTSLGNWLSKMNESGRLQKDVKAVVGGLVTIFGDLAAITRLVTSLVGGFANAVKLLIGLRVAYLVRTSWIPALSELAAKWGVVTAAATTAGGAQAAALTSAGGGRGVGGAAGVAGVAAATGGAGAVGRASTLATRSRFVMKSGQLTRVVDEAAGAVPVAITMFSRMGALLGRAIPGLGIALLLFNRKVDEAAANLMSDINKIDVTSPSSFSSLRSLPNNLLSLDRAITEALPFGSGKLVAEATGLKPLFDIQDLFNSAARRRAAKAAADSLWNDITRGLKTAPAVPAAVPSVLTPRFLQQRPRRATTGPFGTAKPMTQFFQQFNLNFQEQLAQVRASLTRSTRDDVAAAREVVANIKAKIDQGRIHGKALVAALGLEASALSTLWAAEDAAAQKRAAAAQAAKDRAEAAFANLVDPLNVEVELLRLEAAGKSTLPALRKLLASARKALAAAKGLKQQQQALEQIVSVQQQIKDASKSQTVQFEVPAKLALRLARDQALGRDTTKDLLAIKRAILKFIASHRKNIRALTDAYNQLRDINDQINQGVEASLNFVQASTKKLTEGLGLTADQRRRLRGRLSQLGPGGTVPGGGVGAAGFIINPDTGRPIHVHTHVNLDGRRVADNTTKHQHRRRRRNPTQRRGPNAATSSA